MFRYMAFAWSDGFGPDGSPLCGYMQCLVRAGWKFVVQKPGLSVLCAGARRDASEPYALHGDTGVVLGTVFHRVAAGEGPPQRVRFHADLTAAVVRSNGEALLSKCWGQYVAFVRNDALRTTSVVVDPTGTLPCYYFTYQAGVQVFFSDVRDCEDIGLGSFEVDWTQVPRCLLTGGRLVDGATALTGVSMLRPGECAQVAPDGRLSRRFYWNPFDIANTDKIERPAVAISQLHRTMHDCVDAWASGHNAILHRLSGGIDSNIVLACLARVPSCPTVTSLNYFSAGSDTDERELARAGAGRARSQLLERRRNSTLRLESIFKIAPSPTPTFYVTYLENSSAEREIAQAAGATAIFSGGSGDGVFYQARGIFGAGDHVFHHGIRPRLLRIAYDIALLERTSIWSVLRRAVQEGRLTRPWMPNSEISRSRKFVRDEVLSNVHVPVHPWFDMPARAPNGKRWHAFLIAAPLGFYNPFGVEDDPEQIHPIQSQPVVELCLRIPTYVLVDGGWDRSIARHAFAEEVPPEIIWRRTKGGMQEHMQSILNLNVQLIRETILDGVLAKQGYLQVKYIDDYLAGRPVSSQNIGGAMAETFECFCLEVWLRRMSQRRKAVAA